jgi:Fe-S-cluster containining protein
LSFPEEEQTNAWLSQLLDAYYIADKGVSEGIQRRLDQGQTLACRKGCSSCCETHVTIPVYPLELVGLYWYVIDKLDRDRQIELKPQLRQYGLDDPCPFLLRGACIVHPMRPLACRHFNVFHTPCGKGEDPYYTRRKDVLTPLKKYKDKALAAMLPFHGITSRVKRKEAIRNGYLHTLARNLQDLDWQKLAERITSASSKGSKSETGR